MFSYRGDSGLPPQRGGAGLAFTDRLGGVTPGAVGSLNLGRRDVDPHLPANMSAVLGELGVDRLVALSQTHSDDVFEPDQEYLLGLGPQSFLGSAVGAPLPVADAVVLALEDVTEVARRLGRAVSVGVCVRTADCMPVLIWDRRAGLVAAAHAGRVGLLAGVLPATVAALRRRGARDLTALIGPRICGDCYEVPAAMAAEATRSMPAVAARTSWHTPALDLPRGALAQLAGLGVPARDLGRCTRTDETLHSYRRDGADSGRLAAFGWFRAEPPG